MLSCCRDINYHPRIWINSKFICIRVSTVGIRVSTWYYFKLPETSSMLVASYNLNIPKERCYVFSNSPLLYQRSHEEQLDVAISPSDDGYVKAANASPERSRKMKKDLARAPIYHVAAWLMTRRAVWHNKIVTATSQYHSPLFRHQRGGIWGICTHVADVNWDWIPESVLRWWPRISGRGSAEDEGRVYITLSHTVYVLSFRLMIRREKMRRWWGGVVMGRSSGCGSLAIIHRQANQASKSGTMELSKSRVGIKAALTGHCNPIEMFTLHLSKGNGCGE